MRKVENLKSLEFSNNFSLISQTLLKWKRAKSLPLLDDLIKAVTSWFIYTHELETNKYYYEKIIEEYRSDKNRAVSRARISEEKLEKIKKELDKYKKAYG
tara:strand:- start:295 stop:594 length:300 start_codon:yes stop_codon:yes gene_type:complete